jgi:hypothetical protein
LRVVRVVWCGACTDKLTKLNYMETMTFLSTLPSVMHNFRSYINIAIEMLEDMASE